MDNQPHEAQTSLRFGTHFLEDHARNIINDPKIALVELIANCWDAGASRVDITWPIESRPDIIAIEDDGIGMTQEQFTDRWWWFNYNRKEAQGDNVEFPLDSIQTRRRAFGRNGKGRHSMFCFTNKYEVDTWRDGVANIFQVTRTEGIADKPYAIQLLHQYPKSGHGTKISTEFTKGSNYLEIHKLRDLIGSKYIVDPYFHIYVNGVKVELTDLSSNNTEEIDLGDFGFIKISFLKTTRGRTSRPHGVAWWVNNRLVGEPSWSLILDARTTNAKSFTFIVQADLLVDSVKEDWTGFNETPLLKTVQRRVTDYVMNKINDELTDIHRTNKLEALRENRENIDSLSLTSKFQIGRYLDEIQMRIPVIDQKVLSNTVAILASLEATRTGRALVEKLAHLDPNDIDTLNKLLDDWTVQEIRIVLDELKHRLDLISSLTILVEDPKTDELHDLHPLFEKGLWIFGPEYETLDFVSNQNMSTVICEFLKKKNMHVSHPRLRPDIVATPDSTLSVHSIDKFDDSNDVSGFEKILIIELKKGGFKITIDELYQANKYADEIRRSGKIGSSTIVTCIVLGATVDSSALNPLGSGEPVTTKITALPYAVVLRKAHARTFHLKEKLEKLKQKELTDPEVEKVLSEPIVKKFTLD